MTKRRESIDRVPAGAPSASQAPRSRPGGLVVLLVIAAAALLLHVYPAVRLLGGDVVMSTWPAVLVGVVVAVLHVGLLALGHARDRDVIGMVGDVWLGIIFQLFVWTLVGEVLRVILAITTEGDSSGLVSVIIVCWTALILCYGLRRALGPVGVVETEVHLPRLHPDLDGVRVVQVSDTHLSRLNGRRWMARVVRQVNAIDADICCHTGDLADGDPKLRAVAVDELGRVTAPNKFYITGNHEYFGDAAFWGNRMNDLGWTFLHNKHVTYRHGEGTLVVAGIDDPTGSVSGLPGHGPDIGQAIAGVPEGAILLLAHQPKQASDAAQFGVDLQLAGHTHGGQMWPFHYLVRADQKYLAGLHRVTYRTHIYVSRGTGFWGPPFRIGAAPEIAVITLRASR